MGKLLNNKYLVRLLAVVLAILLTIFVYSKNNSISTKSGSNLVSVNGQTIVNNIPIYVKDTSKSFFISGLPETVSVELNGPKNIITQLAAKDIHVETEDLTNKTSGKQTIRLVVTNTFDNVTAVIMPEHLEVSLDRRVSEEKNITLNLENITVADGYQMGQAILSPEMVTLTGAKSVMEKVASVSVVLTNETQTLFKETIQQNNLPVVVKDDKGNVLDVNVNSKVDVTLPIYEGVKTVPLMIKLIGQSDKYTYSIEEQNFTEIVVQGSPENLQVIDKLIGTINVNDITENTVKDVTVIVPNNVKVVRPNHVTALVSVKLKAVTEQTTESENKTDETSNE